MTNPKETLEAWTTLKEKILYWTQKYQVKDKIYQLRTLIENRKLSIQQKRNRLSTSCFYPTPKFPYLVLAYKLLQIIIYYDKKNNFIKTSS